MYPFFLSLALWAATWITYEDTGHLARLCWVEVRGMGEEREAACASVVSTVLTRAAYGILSDGTIEGTITWGCGPETVACQFPAYVVHGCEVVREACPFDDPQGVAYFRLVVILTLEGTIRPACDGYVYYGIQDFDAPECRIEADNGQFQNWHRRP